MLCLRNLYHKKHWAQQGSKPGSFTHSTDYIHILRRNHLVEEINMKEAAANPLCNLAREAPRAWEIKTPLAVEILPVNYLHPSLGVALAYFLLVSFLHFRCQPGEQNWTSGCLLYKLIFMKAQQPFLGFFLMELPGDRDLFCSTWLKRKALTGCLCTRTWCCRQLTAQTCSGSIYSMHELNPRQHMETICCCSGYQICGMCSQISHSEPGSDSQDACRDLHAHTSWLRLLPGQLGPHSPA